MNILSTVRKPFKYTFFNATFILIGINLAFYVLSLRFYDLNYICSLNVSNVINHHMYWQFVTYMFIHSNFTHLLSNMLGLLFFGISLERSLGSKEFLLFYFVTGTLSGVFSFFLYLILGSYSVFLMGASGAVYAVLLLFAVAFPKSKIFIWGIIPVPAPILVLIYALIEFFSQFTPQKANVAHFTHLAGFAFAWLYSIIRLGENPWKVWKNNYR